MDLGGGDDDVVRALEQMTGGTFKANDNLVPSGQRPCPICGAFMVAETQRSITLDYCPSHGIWLDNGELQALIRSAKGKITMMDVRRAKREGKVAGALFGVWSLMLP